MVWRQYDIYFNHITNMFEAVLIPTVLVSDLEFVATADVFRWRVTIHEKHGVTEVASLAEAGSEPVCETVRSSRMELYPE